MHKHTHGVVVQRCRLHKMGRGMVVCNTAALANINARMPVVPKLLYHGKWGTAAVFLSRNKERNPRHVHRHA